MKNKGFLAASVVIVLSMLSCVMYGMNEMEQLGLEFIVDQKGGGTFLSIQEAMESGRLAPGDVLKVWWGPDYDPYVENVNVNISDLTIKSDLVHNGGVRPIIDGGIGGPVFNVTARNVAIFNFTIQNSASDGIHLSPTAINTTLIDNILSNNTQCAILVLSGNNTIKRNTLEANSFGIEVDSSGNYLRNNSMINNICNFAISNFTNNDIDPTNKVNGKPICFLVNQHNKQVPTDAGYITIVNSTEITVDSISSILSNNDYGVRLVHSCNVTITNLETSNNLWSGIFLSNITGCRIENVTSSYDNNCGFQLLHSETNQIVRNTISGNGWGDGVQLIESDNNTLTCNLICNNYLGIFMDTSSNNNITKNELSDNQWFNIVSQESSHNIFYHNNIMGLQQTYYSDSFDSWDNDEEGNYWSDYEIRYPDAEDSNGDGIWDHYYKIDDNNYDEKPLVKPWRPVRIFNIAKSYPQGLFKGYNMTIECEHVIASLSFKILGNETYPRRLDFNLTAGSSGFCSVKIPRAWLDGPFNLTINKVQEQIDAETQTATHTLLLFTYTGGKYQVAIKGTRSGSIPGDINRDGKVDMKDIGWTARLFGEELPSNLTPEEP